MLKCPLESTSTPGSWLLSIARRVNDYSSARMFVVQVPANLAAACLLVSITFQGLMAADDQDDTSRIPFHKVEPKRYTLSNLSAKLPPAQPVPDPWQLGTGGGDGERPVPSSDTEGGIVAPGDIGQAGPAASAVAQDASLSLDELRQIALNHNPTLEQARMAVSSATGQQIQAGLYLNPEVGWLADEMDLAKTPGFQGAFIGQEFITAGKRDLARNVAGHGVAAARHALDAQRWRVLNAVKRRFYEVLLVQETVAVHEDLVAVADEAEDASAQLRSQQELAEADLLQVMVEAERSKLNLFEARNRYRTSWFQLAATIGWPQLPPRPLEGDIIEDVPTVTWDEGLARVLALSPEVAQAKARIEQARCNLALQDARRRANIGVEVGVKYHEPSQDTLTDVSLSMPLKIYDRNQGNIFSARAELAAATRELERIKLDLRQRFAEAFSRYSSAHQRVQVLRTTILTKALDSLELTRKGYRAGEYSYLKLLTAERTYFSVNLEYLSSLSELWTEAVALDGYLLAGAFVAE